MRRLGWMLAAMAAVAAAAAGCRQVLPTVNNRFLHPRSVPRVSQSTADARQYFDHDTHRKTFGNAGIECIDCHRFDLAIDTGDAKLYDPLSTHAILPGSSACHFCHQDGPGRMAAAPSACTTCHTNLVPLEPENHQIAWLKVHGTESRANPAQCENCHRQSYCIDCHDRRDDIQTITHERNFLFIHGIEARTNPMQCSACHREDFCINCHAQGRQR